jgi:hypothetical protein
MKLIDPLAQSFYVESDSGIFVTSIDLYFSTKDNNLPVTVQLRPMKLNVPSSEVYPFSEIVLEPGQINTSDDASVPTRVTFSSPVYLIGGTYHSVCILSNSNNHNVWVSRLGEVDKSLVADSGARNVFVSQNPLAGNLFKSQNGSSWFPSKYEDLKFTLYRANFENNGNINFYNPELTSGNEGVAVLIKDPLITNSRKLRVGLGITVSGIYVGSGATSLILGSTITQNNTNASANLVGFAGSATGTLALTNPGIGYSPISGQITHAGVSLVSLTGNGLDGTANITISNGVAIAATVNSGGSGYTVGDVLTISEIGSSTIGKNLRLTLGDIIGQNTLILDNVQGDFSVGTGSTIFFTTSTGIDETLVGAAVSTITIVSDGLHIKVNHKNHGMCANHGSVILSNIQPDVPATRLLDSYSKTSTDSISISDSINFGSFENVGVGSTNPGYVLVGEEVIGYTGVSTSLLTGITRNVDDTLSYTYSNGTEIRKYELAGVSLRRINKTHSMSAVTILNSLDLDFYNIKLDMSTGGIDRSTGSSFPKLFLNKTKSTGGVKVNATQNIIYEIVKPVVQTMTLRGTNIDASIRTVTAHSVAGGELPYVDKGFENISLYKTNYFSSPRMIASKVNESNNLTTLPGKKSFTMNVNMNTSDSRVSPVIDLDRVSVILSSNRINHPISDYATDIRTSTLKEDPSAFVYATKPISLEVPANAIKVLFSGYLNQNNDVRVLYAIQEDSSTDPIYYPFPGYTNIATGTNNNGLPDVNVPKTDKVGFESEELIFRDYEFTVDELPSFRYFSIKIIGTSTNEVYPPRLRDLRIIALA